MHQFLGWFIIVIGALILILHGATSWTQVLSSFAYFEAALILVLITFGFLVVRFRKSAILVWHLKSSQISEYGRFGGQVVLKVGLLMAIVGLIRVLENLDDPARIGPGVALSILSVFYALILNLVVFLPLEKNLPPVRDRAMLPSIMAIVLYLQFGLVMHSLAQQDFKKLSESHNQIFQKLAK